jgi:hypothetical protein
MTETTPSPLNNVITIQRMLGDKAYDSADARGTG